MLEDVSAVGQSGGSEAAPAWHTDIYTRLCDLIGDAKAGQIVDRFRADLTTRFTTRDREMVRRDAHTVTSTAGMLGFLPLSDLARDLEVACRSDAPIEAPLDALLDARRRVLETASA